MENKDHCTAFPEFWYTWTGEKIYIGYMCKRHDRRCGTHGFFKETHQANLIGATLIATVATLACWVKYTDLMKGKL